MSSDETPAATAQATTDTGKSAKSLNATAAAWTPNVEAKAWTPSNSAVPPAANQYMPPGNDFVPQGYPYNPMMGGGFPGGMVPRGMPFPGPGGMPPGPYPPMVPMMVGPDGRPIMGPDGRPVPMPMGGMPGGAPYGGPNMGFPGAPPPRHNKNYNQGNQHERNDRRKDRSGSNLSNERDYHHRNDGDGYGHRDNRRDRNNGNGYNNYNNYNNFNGSYDLNDDHKGGPGGSDKGGPPTPDRENYRNGDDRHDDNYKHDKGHRDHNSRDNHSGRDRDSNDDGVRKLPIQISNVNVPTDGPIERVEKGSANQGKSQQSKDNGHSKSKESKDQSNTTSKDAKDAKDAKEGKDKDHKEGKEGKDSASTGGTSGTSNGPAPTRVSNWAALAAAKPKEKPTPASSDKGKSEEKGVKATGASRDLKDGKDDKDAKDAKDAKDNGKKDHKKASDGATSTSTAGDKGKKETPSAAPKAPSMRDIVAQAAKSTVKKTDPSPGSGPAGEGGKTGDTTTTNDESKSTTTAPAPAPTPLPSLASIVKLAPAAAKTKAVDSTSKSSDKSGSGSGGPTSGPSDGNFRRGLSVEAELGPIQKNSSNRGDGSGNRSGTTSPRNNDNGKDENGAAGWKRGASVPVENLVELNDGVNRYDKLTILALFQKMKQAPPEIIEQYPALALIERHPIVPKHMRMHLKKKLEDEPHPDAALIFDFSKKDENTFQYNAARLAEDTDDPDIIFNKAQLILNKLSLTKFDKLSDEFIAVGLDGELMDHAVEMIVTKAQLEEHFCFMYADLCKKMTETWSAGKAKDEESPGKTFRQKLLDRCRDEFDIDRVEALAEIRSSDAPEDEKDEKEIILKKRYTGHMRFIGELYIKELVTAKVMHTCMAELLSAEEEETLVCMVKLMKTIGWKLEAYDRKKGHDNFQNYFDAIIKTSKDHPSSRMRFMLKDLIDMRDKGWQERREQEKVVDLSKKGSMKNSNSNNKLSSSNLRNNSQDARGGGGGGDEWTTVPTSGKNRGRGFGNSNSNSNFQNGNSNSSKNTGSAGNVFSALSQEGKKKEKGTGKGASFQSGSNKSTSSSNADNTSTSGSMRREDSLNDVSKLERQDSLQSNASSQYQVDDSLPGAQGALSRDDIMKVRTIVDEYYCNQDPAEAVLSLSEKIHPNGMAVALGQGKGIIDMVFEKYPTKIPILNEFLLHLHSSGFLTSEQASQGIMHFLDNFDDTIIDFPKAAVCGGAIIANLIYNNIINLSLFGQLPEENMFSMSYNKTTLIGSTLVALKDRSGVAPGASAASATSADSSGKAGDDEGESVARVRELYTQSGLDVFAMIDPEPNQSSEEAEAEFLSKFDLSFLKG